ncbi:nascent polypeptide-associated complex subunit alpha, muscle-specific form-like [Orcinus orca]|uniref:nascent polypeptide-associated complex subunit alpha, muscle-specific form-like n=1 Tax=Orcinus orca TaxID=9733 RepID=UPI002111170B|nr:nascent polypeptide-associated complex subunit alpha, muscle-specific form-like [Orcinus orca]
MILDLRGLPEGGGALSRRHSPREAGLLPPGPGPTPAAWSPRCPTGGHGHRTEAAHPLPLQVFICPAPRPCPPAAPGERAETVCSQRQANRPQFFLSTLTPKACSQASGGAFRPCPRRTQNRPRQLHAVPRVQAASLPLDDGAPPGTTPPHPQAPSSPSSTHSRRKHNVPPKLCSTRRKKLYTEASSSLLLPCS